MKPRLLKTLISVLFPSIVLCSVDTNSNATTSGRNKESEVEKQFSEWAGRQFANRMLWMTHKRRFVLPTGTILQVTPRITVPVFRQAPYNGGFDSDLQMAWTFYMRFDKLNMTSPDHPWPFFDRPPFYPFGDSIRPNVNSTKKDKGKKVDKESTKEKEKQQPLQHGPGGSKPFPNIKYHQDNPEGEKSMHTVGFKNYYPAFYPAGSSRKNDRKPRSVMSLPPPESIAGGERAIILPSIESLMSSMGLAGRPCLLRAVCEVHQFPLGTGGYGLFGEMITLFFSISESPYAESHMPEYLQAEQKGRLGDCSSYEKNCSKSLFVWEPRESFSDIKVNVMENNNSV